MKNNTLNYYEKNAEKFVEGTVNVDFSKTHNRFLEKLDDEAYILDFGCGSGRDTKYFLELGYRVDAVDGSKELCKKASEYTGIDVKCLLFENLNEKEKYDGIWACSSILHVSKMQLEDVFEKMILALKNSGVIYTSFKFGDFEGERNGRYFTDFTVESFKKFIKNINNIEIEDCWTTSDVRPGRGEEKWLNIILRKK